MHSGRARILTITIAMIMVASAAAVLIPASGNSVPQEDTSLGAVPTDAIMVYDNTSLDRVGTGAEYPTGSGQIWSMDAYYYMVHDISYDPYYMGYSFTPIGSAINPFTGTFDGRGYKIYDLESYSDPYGIFGYVHDATIINLSVALGAVLSPATAGGIAAYSSGDTTIINCSVTGSLDGNTVGGLIGTVSSGSLTIERCSLNVNVIGYHYIGGLIGIANAATVITIADCYVYGAVSSAERSGGIIGAFSGTSFTIERSYVAGGVSPDYNTGTVGGLIGMAASGSISVFCTYMDLLLGYSSYDLAGEVFGATITTDAGTFTPPLASGQESGIKITGMQPSLSDAQSGNSVYYTGTVQTPSGSINGWDFFDVWTIGSTGYPVLIPYLAGDDVAAQYLVMFDVRGGSFVLSQIVEEGSAILLPVDTYRDGYTFMGWFTDISLSTAWDLNSPVIRDMILYAGWRAVGGPGGDPGTDPGRDPGKERGAADDDGIVNIPVGILIGLFAAFAVGGAIIGVGHWIAGVPVIAAAVAVFVLVILGVI